MLPEFEVIAVMVRKQIQQAIGKQVIYIIVICRWWKEGEGDEFVGKQNNTAENW